MLAASVGPNLTKLLHDQLDLMFACGLSEPLHQALVSIARHIPPLLKTIQGELSLTVHKPTFSLSLDRLLDMLSMKLAAQAYKPLGAPPNAAVRQDLNRDLTNAQVSLMNILRSP